MKISELLEADKPVDDLKTLIKQVLDSPSLDGKPLSAVDLISMPTIRNLMPGLTDKQAKDKVNNILSRNFKNRNKRGGMIDQLKKVLKMHLHLMILIPHP